MKQSSKFNPFTTIIGGIVIGICWGCQRNTMIRTSSRRCRLCEEGEVDGAMEVDPTQEREKETLLR